MLIVIVYNLFSRKKRGHEWPRLKIISASKAENKKKWQKSVHIKITVSRESCGLVRGQELKSESDPSTWNTPDSGLIQT